MQAQTLPAVSAHSCRKEHLRSARTSKALAKLVARAFARNMVPAAFARWKMLVRVKRAIADGIANAGKSDEFWQQCAPPFSPRRHSQTLEWSLGGRLRLVHAAASTRQCPTAALMRARLDVCMCV